MPSDFDIAVIGMAGRLPGARDLDTFWKNLCDGTESIRALKGEELDARGVDRATRAAPGYVPAAAALDDMDRFDAAFFGYSPREAELMDPQHRVFLECCWEALEDAGSTAEARKRANATVGVFAGAATNTYLIYNLISNKDELSALDFVQIDVGNGGDFLSTRVSYKLDLRGPSYTVQSGCSTSLVATHVACQSLLNEECDIALAGGASIHVKHPEGYGYIQGGIVSPDGHCRAFDAGANGTVFGSGAGVVVLKRLADALRDGDPIRAVIRGSAINNDGSSKAGYTAPSVEGQAAAIREAIAAAGVSPDSIGYVEAHGTGTKLGDPIEIRALTKAFAGKRGAQETCLIGSLKSNIGHLGSAAGVASLMKAVLTLEHGKIPPSLHFASMNPEIGADSPFVVNAKLEDFPKSAKSPRRSGVSSFGIGGTNAHVVLEEAPARAISGPSRAAQLVVLSAKSRASLDDNTARLAGYLRAHPDTSLADVAHTLQSGRAAMSERRAIVCRDRGEAIAALEGAKDGDKRVWTRSPRTEEQPVAFLFSGQGSQYAGMTRELYATEPTYKAEVDRCAELLEPHLGADIRKAIFAEGDAAADALRQTATAQAALFTVEYALARLWMEWGVEPAAMLGHSIGEYVAACIAGVFSLPDAIALVAARGRVMQSMPGGAMTSIMLAEDAVAARLGPSLAIAAVNAKAVTIVSGPTEDIAALEAKLAKDGVNHQRLHTSHAFHSKMMDPARAAFAEHVRKVKLSEPKIPFVSNVTGTWIDAKQATDPEYWASHLRAPVRFAAGIAALTGKRRQSFLEVGPGTALSTLTRAQIGEGQGPVVASTRHAREPASDVDVLLGALAQLWLAGVPVDWAGFAAHETRRRLPLPTYAFERRRHWIDERRDAPGESKTKSASRSGAGKIADIARWFYAPSWKRAPLPPGAAVTTTDAASTRARWLIFADDGGVATSLAAKLRAGGKTAIVVRAGTSFSAIDAATYTVRPADAGDHRALITAVTKDAPIDAIVHAFGAGAKGASPDGAKPADGAAALETGFYSLLALAQALGDPGANAKGARDVACWVVATGAYAVESTDHASPYTAMALGPCLVTPQEHPHLTFRFIDVAPSLPGASSAPSNGAPRASSEDAADEIASRLFAEVRVERPETEIAYRGRRRWVRALEAVHFAAGAIDARPLRDGSVYLVTNGLSGIGWAIVSDLVANRGARVALVEDTDFPEDARWPAWRGAHPADDPTTARIDHVVTLRERGADVRVYRADLGDEAAMARAVAAATKDFGTIDAVVHAASRLDDVALDTVEGSTREGCELFFAPRLRALEVLKTVLPEGVQACVLVSSLSSSIGGLGQVAHAAASRFMDTFAETASESTATPWISVGWDAWQLDGARSLASVSPALAELAILQSEGVDAAHRIVTQANGGAIAVSTSDIHERARRRAAGPARRDSKEGAPRTLTTPYVAPRSDLERVVAGVWSQVLGIQQIGVHDNFFDLGGHSLLATQLRNQIHGALKVDLPLQSLFETPTVAEVVVLIERELERMTSSGAPEKPIAARLREAFPTERAGILEEYLAARIKNVDVTVSSNDVQRVAAELEYDLKKDFKFQLYPHELREHPGVPDLARYLLAEMDRLAHPARFVSHKPLSSFQLKPYRKRAAARGDEGADAAKNPGMVFVHSSPRAGSTLFRVMLAGHPGLFCPPEVNLLFFDSAREWRDNIGFGHEMDWTTGGLKWAFMELLGLESEAGGALVDRLVQEDAPAAAIYAQLQKLSAPRLLVDKTPSYSLDIETLRKTETIFDRPKHIYLYRHPYPVMESILRVRFDRLFGPSLFGEKDVDPHVVAETVWSLCNRNIIEFMSGVDPARTHWVRYEDLVRDPRAVMERVSSFIGIPFDERVLKPYDGRRERMMGGLGDPNFLQHTKIEADLGDSWKRIQWPRRLDATTRALVEKLGYEVPDAPAPAHSSMPPATDAQEAERLLANLNELTDDQVAALLGELSGEDS